MPAATCGGDAGRVGSGEVERGRAAVRPPKLHSLWPATPILYHQACATPCLPAAQLPPPSCARSLPAMHAIRTTLARRSSSSHGSPTSNSAAHQARDVRHVRQQHRIVLVGHRAHAGVVVVARVRAGARHNQLGPAWAWAGRGRRVEWGGFQWVRRAGVCRSGTIAEQRAAVLHCTCCAPLSQARSTKCVPSKHLIQLKKKGHVRAPT